MKNLKKISRNELKKIIGGLDDLRVYNPDDPCMNYTEIVPTGCPCTSDSQCPTRFGPKPGHSIGSLAGACINGVCAGSVI
ncbi:hypothetical protein CMT92_07330 [Elizabethkingia anophelis]|uniref:bacteriocin-like protein n=1 Tax=Elizabethkingia anophelis TaxID=1117645 RepID=UPI0021A3F473|nr:hypothetical protein [Elizabethkingia anophelis]MCT3871767.1 hypothetical protein [Elizabethkingia anophelis]MDV3847463.1 hypothetical protein [Elizabethkingia anophelis]